MTSQKVRNSSPLTHQESRKIWDGPGDKIKLLFYSSVEPPTPGQGCCHLVNDLSMASSE